MASSSRTAIIAISRHGAKLASTLNAALEGVDLYVVRRFADGVGADAKVFDLPVRPVVADVFERYDRLVMFMPVGAAVRLISGQIGDKHIDPAIVCVDDAGKFVVSLLSGHVGGADAVAEQVASVLGATPVITSASHALGTFAVDTLGIERGWQIEAPSTSVTRASAAVINGDPVGVFQDAGEPIGLKDSSGDIRMYDSMDSLAKSDVAAALIVTDRLVDVSTFGETPVVVYRPKSLVAGMGCRRGVPVDELETFLRQVLSDNSLAIDSLESIATSEVKRDDVGLNELAENFDLPIRFYSADDLNSRPGPSGPSAASKHLSVVGVSEPAAMLASGCDGLIVPKTKAKRATVAVARIGSIS